MIIELYQVFALCVLLTLTAAAAPCDPTFMGNVKDLHQLKAQAKSQTLTFPDIGKKTLGNFIVVPSDMPTVSLDNITSVNDFGCNTDIKNAYVFKLRLVRGDSSRLFVFPGSGSWQIREIKRGDVCPGVVYDRRCRQTATYVTFKDVKGPMELLIIMQPDPNKTMKLWWNYIPNPARQVDTCQLANNGVCDYDSGKCLMGTDCSDCGESNCQATECISANRLGDVPEICDDPRWESLPAGNHLGSKGPWDCQSLEREMRLDCSGCRCEIQDACTDEVKDQCRASNREICERGSGECGACLDGYTLNTTICEPNPCDDAAKEACRNANKETCGEDFHCGGCLPGFGKVSDICVDVSKCTNSNVPSRMVMLMDTSGSLDNPLYRGRYGNFRKMKNLAMDLVNVFPINEYAIRSFSNDVTPYPASGEFVGKSEAKAAIESMAYDNLGTYTGKALEHVVSLLEDKTDSFNIVVVLTDGKSQDGTCKSGETCKLQVQAPRLQELPDRNETVTVVSVGFGQIDTAELQLIASGEGSNNTIIAEGSDASAGLAALHDLLGSLVEKVCLNLPVDCVVGYSDWSECPDECGQQYQFSEKRILVESKNGGKACPDSKQMQIQKSRLCPALDRCMTTSTTTSTTTASPTTTSTTTPTTTISTSTPTTTPAETESQDQSEDSGLPNIPLPSIDPLLTTPVLVQANIRSSPDAPNDSSMSAPTVIIVVCVAVVVVIGIIVGSVVFLRKSDEKSEPKTMDI